MTPSMHAAHCGRVIAAAEKVALTLAEPCQAACSVLFPAGTPGGWAGASPDDLLATWQFLGARRQAHGAALMKVKMQADLPAGTESAAARPPWVFTSSMRKSKDDSLKAPTPQWNDDGSLAGMNACSSEANKDDLAGLNHEILVFCNATAPASLHLPQVEYLSAWYSSPPTLLRMAFALKCNATVAEMKIVERSRGQRVGGVAWME